MYLFFFLANSMPFVFWALPFFVDGALVLSPEPYCLALLSKIGVTCFFHIFFVSLRIFSSSYVLCVDFTYIYIIVASVLNRMCGFLRDFYDVRPGISCLS